MADFYKKNIPIIDTDQPDSDVAFPGEFGRGAEPRDYDEFPEEMYAAPSQIRLIPRSEWDARYDEQEKEKSSLEHIYLSGGTPKFVNLNQGSDGYCWAYSTGHAVMMKQLSQNTPLVRINPHATAAIIKRGRNEGGWCGLSAKFAREHGWAVEGTGSGKWPARSRNLSYDTPALRESMAKYKTTDEIYDMARQEWNQQMTLDQVATMLFGNHPCPVDFNWWAHSVCAIRWVRISAGNWGLLILNSWAGWGRHGLAVLQGSRTVPNAAVCLLSSPSVVA